MEAMGYLHGCDLSDDQGSVEWPYLAAHADAVMIQVGYATARHMVQTWTGRAKMDGAARYGTMRGPYFFAYPTNSGPDAEEQGAAAIAAAKAAGWRPGADLPLALDIEVNPEGMAPGAMSDWIGAFLAGTHIDPKHLAVYSMPGFWNANTDGTPIDAHCWVAAWGAASAPRLKGLPAPFLWQTSQRGHLPGIRGPVDLDTLLYVPDAGLPPGEGKRGTVTWTVRAGQTLEDVARQYLPRGATPAQVGAACFKIMAANNLSDTAIKEGEQIDVPQPL